MLKDTIHKAGDSLIHVTINTAKHVVKTLKTDTGHLVVRHFNAPALHKLSQSEDFYYEDERAYTGSWWNNFWRWFWQFVEQHLARQTAGVPNKKYILAGIILILLIVVLNRYLRKNGSNILGSSSKKIFNDVNISENIHEISFQHEIEKALSQNNYRLAVRLHYLHALKQLNDAGLIKWRAEKTNSAYLREIQDQSLKDQFGTITRQFEYVWYGDFSVDSNTFQNISNLFSHFKRSL